MCLWVNSLEISWITLKSIKIPWNPLNYFKIPFKSLWIPSNPFDISLNPIKTLQIPWNFLKPLYFCPCTWNTLNLLELPRIIWKPFKYWHTYKWNLCLPGYLCLKSPEIHWNPIKVLEITWNPIKFVKRKHLNPWNSIKIIWNTF